jgi:hypothetical protein
MNFVVKASVCAERRRVTQALAPFGGDAALKE